VLQIWKRFIRRLSTVSSLGTPTTMSSRERGSPLGPTAQLALIASIVSEWDHLSRRIFVLRKVYDFDHAEIAARTGISAHRVFDHRQALGELSAGGPGKHRPRMPAGELIRRPPAYAVPIHPRLSAPPPTRGFANLR
jgi:hypothetical protein